MIILCQVGRKVFIQSVSSITLCCALLGVYDMFYLCFIWPEYLATMQVLVCIEI